jgi:hypothetical protein
MSRLKRALAGTGAAVLAAVTLVSCSGYTDGARPGVLDAGGGGTLDSVAHQAVVQLPLGPLTIQTGKPEQSIDSFDSPGRAADGAKWVPVAWTLAGNGADYDNVEPAFQFAVTLIADGRRYDLQAGQSGDSDTAASQYMPVVKEKSLDVVVQGKGEHLQADVEYDGVTQTVDFDSGHVRSGVAAPLYRKTGSTALTQDDCPLMSPADERHFRASTGTTCTIGAAQKTPYVGGLGWVSSANQTWVTVPLDVMLIEFDSLDTRGEYSYFDIRRVTVTVDGQAPTTEILRYRDNDRLSAIRDGVLVFRTAANPKSLHITTVVATRNEYRTSQTHVFRGDKTYALS